MGPRTRGEASESGNGGTSHWGPGSGPDTAGGGFSPVGLLQKPHLVPLPLPTPCGPRSPFKGATDTPG